MQTDLVYDFGKPQRSPREVPETVLEARSLSPFTTRRVLLDQPLESEPASRQSGPQGARHNGRQLEDCSLAGVVQFHTFPALFRPDPTYHGTKSERSS